jgi:hypothetical protein
MIILEEDILDHIDSLFIDSLFIDSLFIDSLFIKKLKIIDSLELITSLTY